MTADMDDLTRVVVLGGGTAGWMTAAALASLLPAGTAAITLVESEAIGTVGVGEATLPHLRAFNEKLGVLEADFMRRTRATFKLGINFLDWGVSGSDYIHPFGAFGRPLSGVGFHHLWHRAAKAGFAGPLESYSLAISACRAGRFDYPDSDLADVRSTFDYAYHLDAGLYAAFLRSLCEKRGVERREGRFADVLRDPQTGLVQAVRMEDGTLVDGDLFVDCTGFRSLILGDALGVPWRDWSRWLPCDRAWAVQSERLPTLPPYTRAIAREAGWQWRIPLQHRTGNGLIYASRYMDDEVARKSLMDNLPTEICGEPRMLQFSPGRRTESWSANCIGVGLSSGFLEPLESTSIYLIQVAAMNLVALFPKRPDDPVLAGEFNRRMDVEYDRIRDFLILHYHANGRTEPMWRDCREMSVPDSLREKIEMFQHRGSVPRYGDGLFSPPSWISVLFGQGERPRAAHPLAWSMDDDDLVRRLSEIDGRIRDAVGSMPSHDEMVSDMGEYFG